MNALTIARRAVLSVAISLALLTVVAGTLHVHTSAAEGFNTHSVWYDDGQEVTVVDAQFTPAFANTLLATIKRQTASPVTRVIVTHPSPDKFNGLSAFHTIGAQSIASVATAAAIPGVDAYKRYYWTEIAKIFTAENYPKIEPIKTTFTDHITIELKSGETISLFALNEPSVASDQTVVRFDQSGDLAVGDLVHINHHAWLEGGIVNGHARATLDSWKRDLAQLPTISAVDSAKVYGGRGEFVTVKEAVRQQTAYLARADQIVGDYLKGLGPKVAELNDPATHGNHYAALQAKFVTAYPDYAFPDFIKYSIYGLIAAKLPATY